MTDYKSRIPSVRSVEKESWRQSPHLSFFTPLKDVVINHQIPGTRVFSLVKDKHMPCLSEEIICVNVMHLPRSIFIFANFTHSVSQKYFEKLP